MLMLVVLLILPIPVGLLATLEVDLEATKGVNAYKNFAACMAGVAIVFVIGFPIFLWQFGVASAM